jgi:hypothetical protein
VNDMKWVMKVGAESLYFGALSSLPVRSKTVWIQGQVAVTSHLSFKNFVSDLMSLLLYGFSFAFACNCSQLLSLTHSEKNLCTCHAVVFQLLWGMKGNFSMSCTWPRIRSSSIIGSLTRTEKSTIELCRNNVKKIAKIQKNIQELKGKI